MLGLTWSRTPAVNASHRLRILPDGILHGRPRFGRTGTVHTGQTRCVESELKVLREASDLFVLAISWRSKVRACCRAGTPSRITCELSPIPRAAPCTPRSAG
jgi:hypothetical protein